jgi:hypothetical protein
MATHPAIGTEAIGAATGMAGAKSSLAARRDLIPLAAAERDSHDWQQTRPVAFRFLLNARVVRERWERYRGNTRIE